MSLPPQQPGDFSGSSLPRDVRARRRVFLGSVARMGALTTLLLVLYAVTPLAGRSGAGAVLGLMAGLTGFAVLTGWQISAITRATYPEIRGVETVLVALIVLLVVFAFTYASISESSPDSFSQPLSRVAAFYFTVSTFATVGFGDVTARTDGPRVIVTIQMLLDLALIAGAVRVVLIAVRMGLRRQRGEIEGG